MTLPAEILPSEQSPLQSPDRFDCGALAVKLDQARHLFSAGDMRAAFVRAQALYDEAGAARNFAARMKASEDVIAHVQAIIGEALDIESYAKVALANEYDAAQAAGMVATRGRPKKVNGENLIRLEDVGLSKGLIFDARKLRDAELQQPGLIREVIATRVAEGLIPTRANLRAAVGTASATKDERGDNFYQTPPVATLTLLAMESFSATVWEPACGYSAIGSVLEENGYDVVLSDLVDRGAKTAEGIPQSVGDFLLSVPEASGEGPDIVTNPPYGDILNAFVAHALRVHKPRKMALLLNFNFFAGYADDDRNFVMEECPPARVYVFKHRLPMMHREGYDGKKASSRMNTAWFVWELQEDGTYGDTTVVKRVDWADFADAESLLPGAGGNALGFSFEDAPRTTVRRTLDERVDINRGLALDWIRTRTDFSRLELCQAIAIRDTTAEALIAVFQAEGLISEADEAGRNGRHAVLTQVAA
ncbi:MAG: hypothetical protein DI537_41405 [Stutzerimonas stutzeri]|nr:MAG: hypothetical protein DI537_41405 [Stutzerimonas stutzeri]